VPIRVITGSANAGTLGVLHACIGHRASLRDRSLLALPSAPDVSRALEDLVDIAPIGLEIATFDDVLDGLWMAHGDGRRIVTPVQRFALMEESANHVLSSHPGGPPPTPGVLKTLAVLAQRAGEAPWKREQASESGSDPSAYLMECLASYEALLARAGLIERTDAQRQGVASLEPTDLPGFIVVSGFTGLTRAQERFVTSASSFCDVVVGLTFDERVPATAAAEPLTRRLERHGTVESLHSADDGGLRELSAIERYLGGPPPRVVSPAGEVRLSEAWGPLAEAARIAREVQEATDAGMRPDAIAIIFRDVGSRMDDLRSALDEAGILAEFDARIPLHRTGMGRTLLSMLHFCEEGTPLSTFTDVLRSPYSPVAPSAVDAMDAALRRGRLSGVREIQRWASTHHAQAATFVRDITRLCHDPVSSASEKRWYRLTSEMLRRARCGQETTDAAAMSDAAAVRVLIDAVRGLGAVGDHAVTSRELRSALKESSVAIRSGNRAGYVQVMGAERARGRRYDCVILGGLNAGEFPRRSREDVLSAPAVAKTLSAAGIDVTPRGGLELERLLFYQATTRASKRLVLSWQSHDAEGRPLTPSVFLAEVLDLYRGSDTGEDLPESMPHQVLRLESFSAHGAAPVTERRELRARASAPPTGADSSVIREARRRSLRARATLSEEVRRSADQRTTFSASEIETYLQCPYRWCIQHLIRPRGLDDQLDASAQGRIAHAIMAAFYSELERRTGAARVTDASIGEALAIHADVAAAEAAHADARTAAEAAAVRAAVTGTRRLVEEDATFLPSMTPLHHEWAFGLEDGDGPEEFDGFSLVGRVDRIDADGRRAVIIDYKLGTLDARRGAAGFEANGFVQLPLYAAVVARRTGLEIAGGAYRSVGRGKPRGFILEELGGSPFVRTDRVDSVQVKHLVDDAIKRAALAAEGIRAGEVTAHPRSGECPGYCPARGFCAEWKPGNA